MKKRILVLAPHTDDAELGMGGTIAKLIEAGHGVVVSAFSYCGKQELIDEFYSASKILGNSCSLEDFEVRQFPRDRQMILDVLVKWSTILNPDIIYVPSRSDVHQDHATVTAEAIRAFKKKTIYGYELPWNNLEFKNTHYEILTEKQLTKKESAILCYKSQDHRTYTNVRFIQSWAEMRGVQIGSQYAECFEVIRSVNE